MPDAAVHPRHYHEIEVLCFLVGGALFSQMLVLPNRKTVNQDGESWIVFPCCLDATEQQDTPVLLPRFASAFKIQSKCGGKHMKCLTGQA